MHKTSLVSSLLCLVLLGLIDLPLRGQPSKIRTLVVYGGHDFQTNQFFALFQQNSHLTFLPVHHQHLGEWLQKERAGDYDVLVLYDMWQDMPREVRADLVARLKEGKGLVALHHSLCSYQGWDEYQHIIGGRYHLQKWLDHGVEKPASTYQHDVDFTIHPTDPAHPVTRGLTDFSIRDEAYGGTEVDPDVHVLLTTEEPRNGRSLAWAKTYGLARVVYLQLGHDHQAYDNPNYRRLVDQAIHWVAQPHVP